MNYVQHAQISENFPSKFYIFTTLKQEMNKTITKLNWLWLDD